MRLGLWISSLNISLILAAVTEHDARHKIKTLIASRNERHGRNTQEYSVKSTNNFSNFSENSAKFSSLTNFYTLRKVL